MSLREALHVAALDNPFYGYRRLTAELKRQGWQVGQRRIRRLMRQDNLLRLRKRRTKKTTDSTHGWQVYPNLAKGLKPTAPNQLWGADLTYVRLGHEFVYAALILDLFSRRAVGWAVGPSLATELPLAALEQALAVCDGQTCEPMALRGAEFGLARVLVTTGGSLARARELAKQAREGYAKIPKRWKKELIEVDAWLEEHGGE